MPTKTVWAGMVEGCAILEPGTGHLNDIFH
jgi:hypothetical protein